MSDAYQSVRSLPFPAVASLLGIDLTKFKRRKDEWNGYCPIHGSQKNQTCFSYNDSGKFHCFSCNEKGSGAIDLTKLVLKIGFKEAIDKLSAVQIPTQALKDVPRASGDATEPILKPLEKDTWRKFQVPCEWLVKRIPDAAIREKYGVFCYNNPARKSAYSGRVMIPIKDTEGILYGYLGRKIQDTVNTDEPKYLFPRDFPKSRFLFGAYELRQHLALHLAGISSSPASRYKDLFGGVGILRSTLCFAGASGGKSVWLECFRRSDGRSASRRLRRPCGDHSGRCADRVQARRSSWRCNRSRGRCCRRDRPSVREGRG